MTKFFTWFPDSLVRVSVVFVVLLGGVLLARMLMPAHLISNDLHESTTIDRELAKEVHYAGSAVCVECHDENKVKEKGYHHNLSCETCHGAAKAHTEDPDKAKPVMPRIREFCTHCHKYDPSRPTGFPQVNPVAHNPLTPCVSCHNPHDPKPPTVPKECEACHAEIGSTKAVSPHVKLECTTCHSTPVEHKIRPREVKASVPTTRDFCAKCHATESTIAGTPKVDVAIHGEKYLCWQCHYPHMPEVGVYE